MVDEDIGAVVMAGTGCLLGLGILVCLVAGGGMGMRETDTVWEPPGHPEHLPTPSAPPQDIQIEQGRHGGKVKRQHKLLMTLLAVLKLLGLTVGLPLTVALALYSAWKGITISLMAFLIATMVGLKSLLGKSHDDKSTHNVIVAKIPGGGGQHEHWWRRLAGADLGPTAGGGGALLGPYRGYDQMMF